MQVRKHKMLRLFINSEQTASKILNLHTLILKLFNNLQHKTHIHHMYESFKFVYHVSCSLLLHGWFTSTQIMKLNLKVLP